MIKWFCPVNFINLQLPLLGSSVLCSHWQFLLSLQAQLLSASCFPWVFFQVTYLSPPWQLLPCFSSHLFFSGAWNRGSNREHGPAELVFPSHLPPCMAASMGRLLQWVVTCLRCTEVGCCQLWSCRKVCYQVSSWTCTSTSLAGVGIHQNIFLALPPKYRNWSLPWNFFKHEQKVYSCAQFCSKSQPILLTGSSPHKFNIKKPAAWKSLKDCILL